MSRREAVDFVDGGITAAAREDSVKSLLDAAVSAITRAASEELLRVGELLRRLREAIGSQYLQGLRPDPGAPR